MNRRGITRTLLIRVPSTASSAGSKVSEARTETTGINRCALGRRVAGRAGV
jgi:hypothetical protein